PNRPPMTPRRSPPPRSASHRHRRRPGPEDGASAPHPSYPWQWRAGAAHQNHPAAGSAWRTSVVRHLESDSRRYGNPQRVTLSETWYKPCASIWRRPKNAVSSGGAIKAPPTPNSPDTMPPTTPTRADQPHALRRLLVEPVQHAKERDRDDAAADAKQPAGDATGAAERERRQNLRWLGEHLLVPHPTRVECGDNTPTACVASARRRTPGE